MTKNKVQEAILALMRQGSYAPLTAEQLLRKLAPSGDSDAVWRELLALEANGEIIRTRFGAYGLPERMGLIAGRFQLSAKGFGFVIPDKTSGQADVFIPPRAIAGAMNNDRVLARLESAARQGRKREGEIIRIISHATSKIVGTFNQSESFAFVVPDDKRIGQDIYITRRNFNGAQNGQKVLVEICEWPEANRKAVGKVVEILGNIGDVGLEILSIIKQNDLPLEFPQEVLAAAKRVPKSISATDVNGRRDLRDRLIVTIDGEDAKDLDDAIYVEKSKKNEYLLGVYIADVSYYVKEDGALDLEAQQRGTSVYLVDRVLPMLPERLSNGICSLNAGEDRLVLACEMRLDGRGAVKNYEIFPAVIKVRHRLSYNIVRELLAGDAARCAEYPDLIKAVALWNELRAILHAKRLKRGAIDFALPEQKVILDEKLRPLAIVNREHGAAEAIIEEFMLEANETVARHMAEQHWPFVYRVHALPSAEKMQDLARLLANFNIKFTARAQTQARDLQLALRAMQGRPEERLVTTVALRSMKQAVYQTENIGHFGLAAEYYTHFTSPIRRYPDLLVHRLLRAWLAKPQLAAAKAEALEEKLAYCAEHSSQRERAAADAERATVELKKCEYMAEHIGEEYDGVVSGVMAYGMYVELANGVEGLVHISSLMDDYYEYHEEQYALIGRHSNRQYRLGDKVRIEVLQVNIADVSIDFIMAGANAAVREHIRQQLLSRQSHSSAGGQHAFSKKDKNAKAKKSLARDKKGVKNKEPGRRSGKHGKNEKKRKKKK